jgi:hypothetical protein
LSKFFKRIFGIEYPAVLKGSPFKIRRDGGGRALIGGLIRWAERDIIWSVAVEAHKMADIRVFNQRSTNVDVQALTEESAKLLRMSLDALYATLGGQLLGTASPTKVAGIISYVAAVRAAADAKALHAALPAALSLQDLSDGFGAICEDLMRDGMRYLSGRAGELREALNNEDILRLSDETSTAHIQVILMVVAAVLRLPRDLDTLAVTVTAILIKRGLRNFCREESKQ